MSLDAEEFLCRFCLHILPPKFMKIRHYGILASRVKPKLRMQQMLMGGLIQNIQRANWKEISKTKLNFDVDKCPCCKTGTLIRIMSFDANAPPFFGATALQTNQQPANEIINSSFSILH